MSTQEEKKRLAAQEAIKFIPHGEYIGVGTGSTVNYFIEALSALKDEIRGAVTTSKQSATLLKEYGIEVISLNEITQLPVYVDGADEVNHSLQMVKGGGGALLAEKIVASASRQFICIVDDSKYVTRLGRVPLAIEVLPYARSLVARKIVSLGGIPELRVGFTTEQGNQILDVRGLNIDKPFEMELEINKIIGVVENGIFAQHPAHTLIIGQDNDAVKIIEIGPYSS